MIECVLSVEDVGRLRGTIGRLDRAGLAPCTVTGGIAIAWHLARAGGAVRAPRLLHDLDLVVPSFDTIPPGLGDAFALRHVHPDALPGRMLVQAFDRAASLRIDIFGAHGRTLERSRPEALGSGSVLVVSSGDILARLTALLLDLGLGETVPPKHARDFSALIERGGDPAGEEAAWSDHRRLRHPASFAEARADASALVAARADLLVDGPSPFAASPCARCRDHPTLKVAAPGRAAPTSVDGARSSLVRLGAPR